jgi:hypothetical protein
MSPTHEGVLMREIRVASNVCIGERQAR